MSSWETRCASGLLLTTLLFSVTANAAADPQAGRAPARENVGPTLARATFAGGCFWCMEPPFEGLPGVASVTSGYCGGRTKQPTYEEVSSGWTGHAESVQIVYDPAKIGYGRLLEIYWRNIDPTSRNGQFCDRGTQYRAAIFYHDGMQRRLAFASRNRLIASGRFTRPIVTEIEPFREFYPAEAYHQDYYRKNPLQPYCLFVIRPKVAKLRKAYLQMLKAA